jgi:hypothetical protein
MSRRRKAFGKSGRTNVVVIRQTRLRCAYVMYVCTDIILYDCIKYGWYRNESDVSKSIIGHSRMRTPSLVSRHSRWSRVGGGVWTFFLLFFSDNVFLFSHRSGNDNDNDDVEHFRQRSFDEKKKSWTVWRTLRRSVCNTKTYPTAHSSISCLLSWLFFTGIFSLSSTSHWSEKDRTRR